MFSRFAALPSFHEPFPLEKVEMFWNLVEKSGDERLQDHPAKAGLEEAHCTIVAPWGWCGVHPTSNLMPSPICRRRQGLRKRRASPAAADSRTSWTGTQTVPRLHRFWSVKAQFKLFRTCPNSGTLSRNLGFRSVELFVDVRFKPASANNLLAKLMMLIAELFRAIIASVGTLTQLDASKKSAGLHRSRASIGGILGPFGRRAGQASNWQG